MATKTEDDFGTVAEVADQIRNLAPAGQNIEARAVLDAVRQGLFPEDSDPPDARRVGRFVLDEKVGAGGMGVVFSARDPQLGRKVALKILKSPDAGSRASARLIREARALAKLRHPNVVTVHEVGMHGDEVFIAMDFIEGSTLREWLKIPRSWRAIVELFVQAGQGLAAAHDAGLVHRDFKPDNVLVDDRDAPHVVDFGVARSAGPDSQSEEAPPSAIDIARATSVPEGGVEPTLTAAGALVGTPAYMAPEQLEGRVADARSDQFSFCATLYEALYGVRPFPSESLLELVEAMSKFELATPTSDRFVPRWLRRVMLRGLSIRADERYGSLRELLDRLQTGLRRRTRMVALGAAGATALAATVATWAAVGSSTASAIDCDTGSEHVRPLWNPDRRAALRDVFGRSDAVFGADAWKRAETELQGYADAWVEMHRDACESTHRRGEQSPDMLQARMTCLDRRLAELDALLEIFERADASVVGRAANAADALTPISVCADAEDLFRVTATSPLPEDPRARERVEQLRSDLARLRAYQNAGRYEEGLEAARRLLQEADALGYKPAIADAHYRLGSLFALAAEHAMAERHLETAFMTAVAGGDDATAAAVSATAAHVVGVVLRRHDEGDRWARIAESMSERLDNPAALAARTAQQRGNMAVLRGELSTGRDALLRAVERYREAGRQAELAEVLVNLGVLERRAGNHDTALHHFTDAEKQMIAFYGDHHPRLATLWNNRAALYIALEQWDAAEPELRRAIEVMRSTVAPTHASLGHPINNLGEVLGARGEHERALECFDEAIDIWKAALGPEHPLIAHALTERSLSRSAVGRADDALADAELALQIREREGSTDSELARTRFALAQALPATERDRAKEQMLLARAVFEGGQQDAELAKVDAWLAQVDSVAR